jgi:hypothetical protein
VELGAGAGFGAASAASAGGASFDEATFVGALSEHAPTTTKTSAINGAGRV